jgi:hypothetical protein
VHETRIPSCRGVTSEFILELPGYGMIYDKISLLFPHDSFNLSKETFLFLTLAPLRALAVLTYELQSNCSDHKN